MNDAPKMQEDGKHTVGKKLTPKRIKSRFESIQTEEEPRKARKKRNKIAHKLLVQIANGEVSNAQGAAQAYVEALEAGDTAQDTSVDD
jgi:hypothetical protein